MHGEALLFARQNRSQPTPTSPGRSRLSQHMALLVVSPEDGDIVERLGFTFDPREGALGVSSGTLASEEIEAFQDLLLDRAEALERRTGGTHREREDDLRYLCAVPARERALLEEVWPEIADRIETVSPDELDAFTWDEADLGEGATRGGR